MKKVRLFTIAAIAAIVSLSVISCGDDQYSIPEEKENPAQTPGTDTTESGTENASPGNTENQSPDTIPSNPSDDDWHSEEIIPGNSPIILHGTWILDLDYYKDVELSGIPARLTFMEPTAGVDSFFQKEFNYILPLEMADKVENNKVQYNSCSWYGHYVYKENNWFGIKITYDRGITEYSYIGTWVMSDSSHAVWRYQIYDYKEENIDIEANGGTDFHELHFKKQ